MLKFCVVALLVGVSAVTAVSVNKRELTEDVATQASGCSDADPCTNGGTCVNGSCSCVPWTSGSRCEVVEKCGGQFKTFRVCGYTPFVICAMNETSNIPYCACEIKDEAYDTELKECRKCNCGDNSHGCQFQEGKKVCNCRWGYSQSDNGKCEVAPCDCGPHGSCHFEGWKTICDCNKGFVEVNGTCEEAGSNSTDGSSIKTTTVGSTTGSESGATGETITKPAPLRTASNKSWRTGTIVLGILFAICLIGVVAVFLKLRSHR